LPAADAPGQRAVSTAARQLIVVGLILAAVIGLFVAAESGQQKLADAANRVETAAQREHALGDVLQTLSEAESAQRGYILLGNETYLTPYKDGAAQLPGKLSRLTEAFAAAEPDARSRVDEVIKLSGTKLQEMSESIALYRERGRSAAIALIRTDEGQNAMTQIAKQAELIQAAETDDMLEASRSWRTDRWLNLAVSSGALLVSLSLVWFLRRLVLRYMYSKEQEVEESAEREAQLERVVKLRTEDLSELSTQLQSVAEKERAALSRELHDELGGLLVAARMDLSWLEEKVASTDPGVQAQFKRVHDALQEGVELKRRVVENLRPTLLDNLGLFPALRWQLSDSCGRAGLNCIERYPEEELRLTPEASIAIFRIVQEALTNILKHAQAKNVEVSIEVREDWLVLSVRDDGVGLPLDRRRALRSHGLASMRHRASGFGGQWRIMRRPERGTEIEVRLPLERITAREAATEALPATV
jgi:signal transduction histidine kinase